MTPSFDWMREQGRVFWRWVQSRRRRIVVILGVVLFFYLLGYFSTPAAIPGMCLIYG